jgi:hypothetical protein
MLHQHRVPGGVIRNDIDEHFHTALVSGGDELLQIIRAAVSRIDCVVVAHRVGTADRSFRFELAHGMNRHEPDDIDAKILESIELRGHAFEIARWREGPREYLVDDGVVQPVRTLPCDRTTTVALRT